MFFGQHNHSVDKKGRVFVPAKYREELGQEFMLSRSPDGKRCLCVYPIGEWQKIDEKLKSLPAVQAGKLVRFMYSGAELSTCDSQGRVLIPQNLREYADLKGDAAIIGISCPQDLRRGLWRQGRLSCPGGRGHLCLRAVAWPYLCIQGL